MKGWGGGGAAGPALQSPGCEATVTGRASLSADIKVSSSFPPSLPDLRRKGSGTAVGRRGSSSAPSCFLLWRLEPPLRQDFPAPPPSSSSAYASFLSRPPPTLRPLPPRPSTSLVVDRLRSVRQGEGRSQAPGSGQYVTALKSWIGYTSD